MVIILYICQMNDPKFYLIRITSIVNYFNYESFVLLEFVDESPKPKVSYIFINDWVTPTYCNYAQVMFN